MVHGKIIVSSSVTPGVVGPGDYTEVVSWQLSFQPGESEQCTAINVTDDVILEDSETFSVQLNTTDQAVLFNSSSATVTILDNDSESGSISYQMNHLFHFLQHL